MAQLVTVGDWVKRLTTIPKSEFTIPQVERFIQEQYIRAETLEPYIHYARSHYTRNLIYKCDLFEVLAICWESGQVSAIHNHRGQNCWMATPIGQLRVQNFRVEKRDPAHGKCSLVASDHFDMDAEHPAVVQPEEPVHQVLNLPEFRSRATSVHIYSYPYSSCEVYSLEKGMYSDIPLHYTSEYGKICPDEKLM